MGVSTALTLVLSLVCLNYIKKVEAQYDPSNNYFIQNQPNSGVYFNNRPHFRSNVVNFNGHFGTRNFNTIPTANFQAIQTASANGNAMSNGFVNGNSDPNGNNDNTNGNNGVGNGNGLMNGITNRNNDNANGKNGVGNGNGFMNGITNRDNGNANGNNGVGNGNGLMNGNKIGNNGFANTNSMANGNVNQVNGFANGNGMINGNNGANSQRNFGFNGNSDTSFVSDRNAISPGHVQSNFQNRMSLPMQVMPMRSTVVYMRNRKGIVGLQPQIAMVPDTGSQEEEEDGGVFQSANAPTVAVSAIAFAVALNHIFTEILNNDDGANTANPVVSN